MGSDLAGTLRKTQNLHFLWEMNVHLPVTKPRGVVWSSADVEEITLLLKSKNTT
jgi:hypothetical protein